MGAPWAKIIGRILGRVGDRLDAASDTSGDPGPVAPVGLGESNENFAQNIAEDFRKKNPMSSTYDKMNQREMNPGRDAASTPPPLYNQREQKRRDSVLAKIDAKLQEQRSAVGGPISEDLLLSNTFPK